MARCAYAAVPRVHADVGESAGVVPHVCPDSCPVSAGDCAAVSTAASVVVVSADSTAKYFEVEGGADASVGVSMGIPVWLPAEDDAAAVGRGSICAHQAVEVLL